MTTDPCPEVAHDQRSLSAAALTEALTHYLDRHTRYDDVVPSLTVVGLAAGCRDVLRRGIDRPEDAIMGFTLPGRFSALGVIASSVVATPPQRSHEEAALALGVGRDGTTVSLLATRQRTMSTRHPQGWLIDACRRAVGLATEPCSIAPLAFPIALWLDRLMVAILNAPVAAPIIWADAIEMCPIPSRWRSADPVDLGTTLGSTTKSWRALRSAASHGAATPFGVSPTVASWMDNAMFARWCMGSFPDINNLRSDVEFLASDQVAGNMTLALRAAWSAFSG